MGATPQYVGMYGRPWAITLTNDSGAENLYGILTSNIAVTVRNLSTGQDATSTGAVTILAFSPAQILWQPVAKDYAYSGSFALEIVVTYSTGPVEYDPILFTIVAR